MRNYMWAWFATFVNQNFGEHSPGLRASLSGPVVTSVELGGKRRQVYLGCDPLSRESFSFRQSIHSLFIEELTP